MAAPFDPRLLRAAPTAPPLAALAMAAGVGSALLVVAQAWLLAGLISHAFHGGSLAGTRTTLLLLVAVVVARAALTWAQDTAAARCAEAVKSGLRRRLLVAGAQARATATEGREGLASPAELATLAVRGVDALDDVFARYLPALAVATVLPPAVVVVLWLEDWVSGLTVVATLPLVPVFMILVGLWTKEATGRQWSALGRLSHHFLDVVQGLPTLVAYGRARGQIATIRKVTDDYRRATVATLRAAFVSALVMDLIATLSVALVAVGVGLRLVGGHLDLRTSLFVLVAAPEAYAPLRQVGALFHSATEGREATEAIFAVLEPLEQESAAAAEPVGRASLVRVEGVTVRHPGRETPVGGDGISLTLRPGRAVALVGRSGSGKSSVLAALLGFRACASGRILVGDGASHTDLAAVDVTAWRRQVTWLPQDPAFLHPTVGDAVRFGDAGATDAQVRAALDAAAADFVTDLAAPLEEDARNLSGGQRQRLALARAFLRVARADTPFVLLDEPTASLDAATADRVLAAIRALAADRAVLVVTHDLAVAAACDAVVDLTGAAALAGAA